MANFQKSLLKLIPIEGGWVNDPTDRGGETYRGVTRRNWPKWKGWLIVDSLRKEPGFPKNLANHAELNYSVEEVYKAQYWDVINGGMILNQEIADELFDTAVNMGTGTAIKFLQQSLNLLNQNAQAYGEGEVDGKMDANVLQLTNNYPHPKSLLKALNAFQGRRYIEICLKDSTQEKFFRGWLERI